MLGLAVLTFSGASLAQGKPSAPQPAGAAQGAPTDTQGRARELYRRGSAAFEAGDHALAVRLLREAWALRKTYDVAGALAQAELELNLYRDAAEHLEFCVRNFPLHESQEEIDSVRAELERLRARLARVQLRVVPDGSEVLVNGALVGKSPLELPLYLEPGSYTLGARFGGRVTERSLQTEAGLEQSVELHVDLSGGAAALAPSPDAESPSSQIVQDLASRPRPNYVPVIVTGSATIAAVFAGVGFTLAAAGADDDRRDRLHQLSGSEPCGRGRPAFLADECSEISDLADRAQRFRVASYVSFGLAVVGGVTTALLWPSPPNQASARPRELARSREGAAVRAPTLTLAPGGLGSDLGVQAHLSGEF